MPQVYNGLRPNARPFEAVRRQHGIVPYGKLRSSLILQPIDGAVLAASIVTGRAFPTIKIANDVGCVIAAAAVGLVFLGNLYGIGAGTLVSAFAVGLLIKRLKPVLMPGEQL